MILGKRDIVTSLNSNNEETSRTFVNRESRVNSYADFGYSAIRGLIVPKGFKKESEMLYFQFNPTEISDSKNTDWNSRNSLGYSALDYFWSKGGDRKIQFRLHFEATAGVNTAYFGQSGVEYGNPTYDTLQDSFPRGTTEMCEKLMSFMYPIEKGETRRFVSGGAIPNTRFMPPPVAIFVFGEYYLEAVVDNVDVTHELFNEKLVPIRSTCNVSLNILETEVINQDSRIKSIK